MVVNILSQHSMDQPNSSICRVLLRRLSLSIDSDGSFTPWRVASPVVLHGFVAVNRYFGRRRRFAAVAFLCAIGACSPSKDSQNGNQGAGGVGGDWPAGMGNTAGAIDTAGTGGGRAFPTQACLDKASALLATMTAGEKISQLQQIERVDVTANDITTYGIGSVYSQGSSVPTPNTPTSWADMTDGFRRAANASRLKIPVIYGLDVVHGAGPVNGATVFPHNIGLGATRDPALVEEVASVVADEAAGVGADFPFAPVVAVARDEGWGRLRSFVSRDGSVRTHVRRSGTF